MLATWPETPWDPTLLTVTVEPSTVGGVPVDGPVRWEFASQLRPRESKRAGVLPPAAMTWSTVLSTLEALWKEGTTSMALPTCDAIPAWAARPGPSARTLTSSEISLALVQRLEGKSLTPAVAVPGSPEGHLRVRSFQRTIGPIRGCPTGSCEKQEPAIRFPDAARHIALEPPARVIARVSIPLHCVHDVPRPSH